MKSKLNLQIYLGFAFALLLVSAVSAFSYLAMEQQTKDEEWVTHTYRVKTHADDLFRTVTEMESARRGYRATKDQSFLLPYENGRVKAPAMMDEWLDMIADTQNKKNAREAVAHINSVLAFWRTLDDGVVRSSDAQNNTAIERDKMHEVRNSMQKFYERQQEVLAIRSQKSKNALAIARLVLLAGTLITTLVVGSLMFFILKEFRKRKKAEQLADENHRQVLQLNEESTRKNRVLTAVAKVNDSLQASATLKGLTGSLLDTLIECTRQPAAVIYLADEHQQNLTVFGTAGLTNITKDSYSIGEGPAGQAARHKDIYVMNEIPATHVNISSAGIGGHPASAAYIPLWVGNRLKGVIEVLSWNNCSEENLDLFRLVRNNIAMAINAAQAAEEVQQQKEMLETQQEELRQTNEELSKQAEELQASEEELRVQEEELRQINAELEKKNETIESAVKALDVKAKELELTSKYKSEFLANMSHELRTPLNSILILAKLLAQNDQQNLTAKQTEYANIIHKSGNDLLELINDILDLSKIEAGKVEVEFRDVPVKDIAEDMKLTFDTLAQQKKISFTTSVDPHLPQCIRTDKQRLEQVIKNLLSNAIKFTPPGGNISLTFAPVDKSLELLAITVKDSGIGIPDDKQQLIFQAFQQADGSINRKYGGTGLGLSISKELMFLLGGKIELKSSAGTGSEFTLILPLSNPVPVPQNNIVQSSGDIPKPLPRNQLQDDRYQLEPRSKSILIIEDDERFATFLQDYASSKDYRTIIALSGKEGLQCADTYLPSAIILDMNLPDVDGSTVLQKLKANNRTKGIPVHIISAGQRSSILQQHAIAWLQKPVSREDLDAAFGNIQQVLNSQLKKVLLYGTDPGFFSGLQQIFKQTDKEVQFDYVSSLEELRRKYVVTGCDCIIADIGANVQRGMKNIASIRETLGRSETPIIICLNKDISPQLEMELTKLSGTVIRTSSSSDERLSEELELFLNKVQHGISLDLKPASEKPIPNASFDSELTGKKVLLADDDMRNVFSLNAALEAQGMAVIAAGDGKEAIELLKKHPDVHLVLMDIMMPEMDGYEAIRHIREGMKLKELPVIALTAKAMSDDREKAIQAGASDYITKPVDLQKLFSLMRVWISQ